MTDGGSEQTRELSGFVPPSAGVRGSGRRGIVFFLRAGFCFVTLLVLVAILLAWIAFGMFSSNFNRIVREVVPTVDEAVGLMETVWTIESDARRLAGLHEPFAIGSTVYRLRELSGKLESSVDRLDAAVVGAGAIEEVKAGMVVMERRLEGLRRLVEWGNEAEDRRQGRSRTLGELFASIEASGKEYAARGTGSDSLGPVSPTVMSMLRSTQLLLSTLTTREPRKAIEYRGEFDRQMASIHHGLQYVDSSAREAMAAHLQELEKLRAVFDEQLDTLRMTVRMHNAMKGLTIMNRLSGQIEAMAEKLIEEAGRTAKRSEESIAGLRMGLVGISAAAILGLMTVLVFINRRIVTRMKELQSAMISHVEGIPRPISVAGSDEISDMARSFLFYVEEVNGRESALQERTRELNEALGDLTEKKNILHTAMQSMDQGIIMVDRDMKVRAFNDHIVRLFSLDAGSLSEWSRFEDVERARLAGDGRDGELLEESLERAKRCDRFSFEQTGSDGRVHEIHQSPLEDGGFVRTYKDITERKKVDEELRQNVEDLERFSRLVVEREEKMIELKREINELSSRMGREARYRIVE